MSSKAEMKAFLEYKYREKYGCTIGYKICRFCEKKRKQEKFYGTRQVCRECESVRQAEYSRKRQELKRAAKDAEMKRVRRKTKSSSTK